MKRKIQELMIVRQAIYMKLLIVLICVSALFGCGDKVNQNDRETDQQPSESQIAKIGDSPKASSQTIDQNARDNFTTVDWEALIPAEDLEAILDPPDYILQIEDGSVEDQVANAVRSAMNKDKSAIDSYEKALISTNIIEEMHGKDIRIPGFVVPVEFTDDQQITSFFLVPYFGACLHMPPPPPNQIIFVETEHSFPLNALYDPVWISGKLSTELFEDQIATSAYTMQMAYFELYYPNE